MAFSQRIGQIAYGSIAIGGLIVFSSSDFAIFPFGLLLCVSGLLIYSAQQAPGARAAYRIGRASLALALVALLAGSLGQRIPLTVWTSEVRGEAGTVINVVQYPLSYFTDRYGSVAALLCIGIGALALRAAERHASGRFWPKQLLTALAITSIVLFLSAVIDVYLDGETPGLLVAVLWRVFAISWIMIGVRGQGKLRHAPTSLARVS